MIRYQVTVVKLRSKRTFPEIAEDGIFINEGDIFGGYSHKTHKEDKFLDLWLSNPNIKHAEDARNIVTFGRIKRIENGVYYTRMGTFLVKEVETIPEGVLQ